MKVPVAKIIQLVFEIGVPGVREIIAIWRKGGELKAPPPDKNTEPPTH